MTKKHFIALADYIRDSKPYCEPFTDRQIEHLANFCHAQNPAFNHERWIGYMTYLHGLDYTEQRKQTILQVIGNGLFSSQDESYFTWDGCDYCCPGLGAQVYDVEGYTDLESARKGKDELIEFKLCGHCLNALYYN
jgi:hypothetical protein